MKKNTSPIITTVDVRKIQKKLIKKFMAKTSSSLFGEWQQNQLLPPYKIIQKINII